jgi:hypothetical protein
MTTNPATKETTMTTNHPHYSANGHPSWRCTRCGTHIQTYDGDTQVEALVVLHIAETHPEQVEAIGANAEETIREARAVLTSGGRRN